MLFFSSAFNLGCLFYLVLFYRLKLRVLRLMQGKTRSLPYHVLQGGRVRGRLMRSLDRSRAARLLGRTERGRLERQLAFLTRFSTCAYHWQVWKWHEAPHPARPLNPGFTLNSAAMFHRDT